MTVPSYPCSMATVMGMSYLRLCKPFHSCKKGDDFGNSVLHWFGDVDRFDDDFFWLHSSSLFINTLISTVGGRRRVDRRDHYPSIVLFFAMRSQRIV